MLLANEWKEYELLDAGDGEKLERWGEFTLRRPDGQAIWPQNKLAKPSWGKVDAIYHRSSTGGGNWEFRHDIPKRWIMKYKNLSFFVEPTGFKHTGLFPEQAANWDWMMEIIKNKPKSKVLNLFAYTGAASLACGMAGADVTHVDASKGMNTWAKENWEMNLQKGATGSVRFITDDVKKFVQREIRRGNKYEGIIMDPPVYGRGPNGELWELEKELAPLVTMCAELLSDHALFLLVNTYTASISHVGVSNLLQSVLPQKGEITSGELGLLSSSGKLVLPCGIWGRWERS